jgi:hypothetical protein
VNGSAVVALAQGARTIAPQADQSLLKPERLEALVARLMCGSPGKENNDNADVLRVALLFVHVGFDEARIDRKYASPPPVQRNTRRNNALKHSP